MTDRQNYILCTPLIRANALDAVRNAPPGYVVTVAEPRRTTDQNARLWAMLSDVANAKPEGRNWTPETWKAAFMHALGHQVRFCEGLDGSGPFPLGFHSSRLSVREMADLITSIFEYGDRNKVKWSEMKAGGFYDELVAREKAA